MSKLQHRLPHELDPFRLVEARTLLDGTVPLKQFRRVRSLLASGEGTIQVQLSFDKDELGVPFTEGKITAELQIVCQRCLEPFTYQLETDVALAWVKREADIEDLPLRFEPYLVKSTPIFLNDLLEDEIILALPSVPRHELDKCPAQDLVNSEIDVNEDSNLDEHEESGDNPFSVLETLKANKDSNK